MKRETPTVLRGSESCNGSGKTRTRAATDKRTWLRLRPLIGDASEVISNEPNGSLDGKS